MTRVLRFAEYVHRRVTAAADGLSTASLLHFLLAAGLEALY